MPCNWEWDGLEWQLLFGLCPAGQHCQPPGEAGTRIGQQVGGGCVNN